MNDNRGVAKPVASSLRHRSAVSRDRNTRVTAHTPPPVAASSQLRCDAEVRKLKSREAISPSVRGSKLSLEFVVSRAVRFVVSKAVPEIPETTWVVAVGD